MPISDNVIVMEKEFKSKKNHTDDISCLSIISDTEFLSSSLDMSFKVWDKDLQGCSYTYETHKPLHNIRITGNKNDLAVSSLGDGDFIVIGKDTRNQCEIYENAHDGKIVQIVSLAGQKLENKYFATKCIYGDLSIWSATPHPDRVFTIEYVDQDENMHMPDSNRESNAPAEEVPQPPPKVEEEAPPEEEAAGEEEEEEQLDEDGNPIPKKKPAPVVVVKKDKSGRISSERDCMIEIKWNQSVIQSSATALCFSVYKESLVNIAIVDLKTRRKNNVRQFKLTNKPTKLFQIDENNMLIGTEGGKIEHWTIDESVCKKIYDAHPESNEGISAIIKLKSKSELLRGEIWQEDVEPEFDLVATASFGAKEFRLWKLSIAYKTLHPYLKIETTIVGGIRFLLETTPTQIVAANNKCIKFYDFIDKNDKDAKEKEKKSKEE